MEALCVFAVCDRCSYCLVCKWCFVGLHTTTSAHTNTNYKCRGGVVVYGGGVVYRGADIHWCASGVVCQHIVLLCTEVLTFTGVEVVCVEVMLGVRC